MATWTQLIRKRLLKDVPERLPGLERIRQLQRSAKFEEMRSNRMVIGAFRYGLLAAAGKPQFDRVASIVKRLAAYKKDGNAEHLLDVANLAEIEFVEGGKGFVSVDDGEHTEEKT